MVRPYAPTPSSQLASCLQAAIEADVEYAPLLVSLLGRYSEQRAILLRVAFVMGNLTTTSNEYREQVRGEVRGKSQ